MSSTETVEVLHKKAQACLEKKADIPMSPFWNMGVVAKYNSQADLKYLQEALNYLTCKAREKLPFEDDEKEFLKEVYEAFYLGGMIKGYKEAANLANHYVNGKGKLLNINADVYKTSRIVQATMGAMKQYIKELSQAKKSFFKFKCNNPAFMSKPYVAPLKRMSYRTEGKMKSDGVLEAAQNNQRLHKTDAHFYLEAQTVRSNDGRYKTVWSVDSIYDFEPFERQNYYSEIPLGENILVVFDGLSEYMTKIGVAQVFNYHAEWLEVWS